jgi:malto-oligosyltrehalose trehalohydrolase
VRQPEVHDSAWGPRPDPSGGWRFRLWAPDIPAVSVRLDSDEVSMRRLEAGWHDAVVPHARTGSIYEFVLPDGRCVPDPAARSQQGDVHGPSLIVDPAAYEWRNAAWNGRPWHEAVIYELHVGAFTAEGTFRAAIERLEHVARLGVTAIELMPIGQFSGRRGWGYDGVLPYAPHNAYGTPDDLKALVDAAHDHRLMVVLDVVYNHFGPDGNYLPSYAPQFFDRDRKTPWGAGIDYARTPVRSYFIDNALYWLDEFRFDGLRLDAVDQIRDASEPEFLVELAERVRDAFPDRHIHLCTEDNRNVTHLHERHDGRAIHYTAEWNDDFHNAAHVLLTGEQEGYYADFRGDAAKKLARCLAEGFAFQGEDTIEGEKRGWPSAHLPPTAFVAFLQNHDQIGNRALGERLSVLADGRRLEAMSAMLLLTPHIPLLFMGEEWGEERPFLFFTDYSGDLAKAVRDGRREEFSRFSGFNAEVPDPNAAATFDRSRIDWSMAATSAGAASMERLRTLLTTRREHVVPLLANASGGSGRVVAMQGRAFAVDWRFPDAVLQMRCNFGEQACRLPPIEGKVLHGQATPGGEFASWTVTVGIRHEPGEAAMRGR